MARAISKIPHEERTKNLKNSEDFNKKSAELAERRRQLEIAQRRGRTFSSDPFLPEVIVNPSGKLKSLADSCHFSIEDIDSSNYKTNSYIGREDKKEQKANEKYIAEQIERKHQLENARRRGRTFSSDPFLPEVIVNPSGELKSLADSCHIHLPLDNDTFSSEDKSKKGEEFEKKEEKRKGFLSRIKCMLQVTSPHSSSDSAKPRSFDNSDHINNDER